MSAILGKDESSAEPGKSLAAQPPFFWYLGVY